MPYRREKYRKGSPNVWFKRIGSGYVPINLKGFAALLTLVVAEFIAIGWLGSLGIWWPAILVGIVALFFVSSRSR